MTRTQLVATLVLQGWVPIKSHQTGRAGIFNAVDGFGLVARKKDEQTEPDFVVKRVDRDRVEQIYEECEWRFVTDWHLTQLTEKVT